MKITVCTFVRMFMFNKCEVEDYDNGEYKTTYTHYVCASEHSHDILCFFPFGLY